jgi:hypothetical protein
MSTDIIKQEDKETMSAVKNQDFKQKVSMGFLYIMEVYKSIMSSMLTVFVPQNCNGSICSISDNLIRTDPFGTFTLAFNFITFSIFLALYFNEGRREVALIDNLEVNQHKARDNDTVEENLKQLSSERKDILVKFDRNYMYSGIVGLIFFILNLVFSIIYILQNFLDSQTITVFLTNVLFMITKLSDIYTVINTDKFVFFSAYLTRKIQFNDIDPDMIEASSIVNSTDIVIEEMIEQPEQPEEKKLI